MMSKWKVTGLLWSPSQNRYIQPGEVIELDDETARILLDKQVIEPARYRHKMLTVKEHKYGTDNQ